MMNEKNEDVKGGIGTLSGTAVGTVTYPETEVDDTEE
jgi:hypothetical protein